MMKERKGECEEEQQSECGDCGDIRIPNMAGESHSCRLYAGIWGFPSTVPELTFFW